MTKGKSPTTPASTTSATSASASSSSKTAQKKKSSVETTKANYMTSKVALAAASARWRAKHAEAVNNNPNYNDDDEKQRLPPSFFDKHSVDVSKALLGKKLTVGVKRVYITETEAYRADEEPAAHGYTHRATKAKGKRGELVFGPSGTLYVYQIHQVHALDIVAEPQGTAGCVLIRSVVDCATGEIVNGPGRVCKHLGLTTQSHNGTKLLNQVATDDGGATAAAAVSDADKKKSCFVSAGVDVAPDDITIGKRVGISKAQDLLWRFSCQ